MNNYVVDTLYSVARCTLKVKVKSTKYSNRKWNGIQNVIQTKRTVPWQQIFGDIGFLLALHLLQSHTYMYQATCTNTKVWYSTEVIDTAIKSENKYSTWYKLRELFMETLDSQWNCTSYNHILIPGYMYKYKGFYTVQK